MPAPRSLDAGTNALPRHMRCAQGQNLDWKDQARCKSPIGLPRHAWKVARADREVLGRPAIRWIELALEICATCPVQWDCTRFALAVGERYHTWGVDIVDLKWLRSRSDALSIIAIAEAHQIPVQVAVRRIQKAA